MSYKNSEERKAYLKAYRHAHKEEISLYLKAHAEERKAYNHAHKEERKAYYKAYDHAHKEERKAYYKAYNHAHKEEIKAYYKNATLKITDSYVANNMGISVNILKKYSELIEAKRLQIQIFRELKTKN
jgi:ABC-type nickel/cobalt efflux system permease component RcnA